MRSFSVAIVGAGASGIAAAISAKRCGKTVVLCDKMPQPGKKILASGNGRCNLSNKQIDAAFYNPASRHLVRSTFSKFGGRDIDDFFKELGVELYSENDGRIFPVTNQSASVLKSLELELSRLSVPLELNFDAISITGSGAGFVITSREGKKISCDSVVIAGGGKSYPALGSDGGAYKLAAHFGHTIVETVPVAVPLMVKDGLCHLLQGQRIAARATSIINGEKKETASGDIIFTKYGLSGTCILDITESISIAVNRHNRKDVWVEVDMVPFIGGDALRDELVRRNRRARSSSDILVGILPNKFGAALKDVLKSGDVDAIVGALKRRRFKVTGTRGWNEAEFTAGGVDTREVDEHTLQSKLKEGIYLAGEILDVNGRRGGYNLAWAWASGFVAGRID